MDAVPEEIRMEITSLEQTISNIEKHLEPFFRVPYKETVAKLSKVDAAKLNIAIAYAINTLFYIYLKIQGISPHDHPVKQELARVRLYIRKIKDLTEKQKPPTMKLNAQAAGRFITHALNDIAQDGKENTENVQSKKDSKSKRQIDEDEASAETPEKVKDKKEHKNKKKEKADKQEPKNIVDDSEDLSESKASPKKAKTPEKKKRRKSDE